MGEIKKQKVENKLRKASKNNKLKDVKSKLQAHKKRQMERKPQSRKNRVKNIKKLGKKLGHK